MQSSVKFKGNTVDVTGLRKLIVVVKKPPSDIGVECKRCRAFQTKREKDKVVNILGEEGQTSVNVEKGDQQTPRIISGGNINFGNISGQFAIGNNIVQIQSQGSSPVNVGTATVYVPEGTTINLSDVDELEISPEDRKKVEITGEHG